jgi:DNA-3-methyladenine glycosylase
MSVVPRGGWLLSRATLESLAMPPVARRLLASAVAPSQVALEPLDARFFTQRAIEFAPALLGSILVRRAGPWVRRARIVETEAYLGPKDLASHSSKGRTKRTEVMFGPPGRAYVYLIYGMYTMLNVVVGVEGEAEAVLLRGAEPLDGWEADLTGPGRLARAFAIALADNGQSVTGGAGDIAFYGDPAYRPRVLRRKRVGVDYAGRWKDRLLRFIDAGNPAAGKLRY